MKRRIRPLFLLATTLLFGACGDSPPPVDFSAVSWTLKISAGSYFGGYEIQADDQGAMSGSDLRSQTVEKTWKSTLSAAELKSLEDAMTKANLFYQEDQIVHEPNCMDGGVTDYTIDVEGLGSHTFSFGGCGTLELSAELESLDQSILQLRLKADPLTD
jgi:hypothetical protein